MSLVIPVGAGIVRHQLKLAADPEPMYVTYGVSGVVADEANWVSLLDNLHDLFVTHLAGQVSSVYTLQQTDGQFTIALDNEVNGIHAESDAMTGSATPLPQNCAFLVQKRTGKAGRRNRGRWYLPGVPESIVGSDGTVIESNRAALQTAAQAFLTGMPAAAGGLVMVILHSTGVSGVPAPTVVTQMVVDSRIATQRTRLRR